MTNSLKRIEVSAAIIRRHEMFLATQRPEGKPFAGYWELPGGKNEGRETPEQTLCRELAEELGINVLEYRLLQTCSHTYVERGFTALISFFLVSRFEGEPCAKEFQNLRWITPAEAARLDFLPADTAFIATLGKYVPDFSQGIASV